MWWALLRGIILTFMRIFYSIRFEGKENCPKEGGYVYASNHRSYMDPVLITLAVKRPFAYMAKEELFKQNIFFTAIIKMMGAFPVERGKGDTTVIDTSIEKLEKGKNLVIFPEGTRSYDGKVGKGKTGVALIASKAHRDVIPVGIIFEGPKLKFRSKILVRYGKKISANELLLSDEASSKELKALKLRIMTAITELVEGNKREESV
ncbi:MAG TPA: lysophospholipid acyltransferase family protein [Oscillospiraceae bacterium]|nr:lysophospholipid acyltransferase family protein [Oscillospiraceae bacterium]